MAGEQQYKTIEPAQLYDQVEELKNDNYRFVQACCTKVPEGFELIYSFDKDHDLLNLQFISAEDCALHSISPIYWAAFIYENEMKDLFGVQFLNMELDYGGHFFKVSEETPWNPKERKEGDADE